MHQAAFTQNPVNGKLSITLTEENAAYGGECFGVIKQRTTGDNGRSYFVNIPEGKLIQRDNSGAGQNAEWPLSEFVTGVVKTQHGSMVVATQDGILMAQPPAGTEMPEMIKLADIPGLETPELREKSDIRINNINVVDGIVIFGTGLKDPGKYLAKMNAQRESSTPEYKTLADLPKELRPAKLFMLDPRTLEVKTLKEGFCMVNSIAGHTVEDNGGKGKKTFMSYSDSATSIEQMEVAEFGKEQGLHPNPVARRSFVGEDGRPDGTVAFMVRNPLTAHLEHRFATAMIESPRVLVLDLKLEDQGQADLPAHVTKPTMPTIEGRNDMVEFSVTTLDPGKAEGNIGGGKIYETTLNKVGQIIKPVDNIAQLSRFEDIKAAKGLANFQPGVGRQPQKP